MESLNTVHTQTVEERPAISRRITLFFLKAVCLFVWTRHSLIRRVEMYINVSTYIAVTIFRVSVCWGGGWKPYIDHAVGGEWNVGVLSGWTVLLTPFRVSAVIWRTAVGVYSFVVMSPFFLKCSLFRLPLCFFDFLVSVSKLFVALLPSAVITWHGAARMPRMDPQELWPSNVILRPEQALRPNTARHSSCNNLFDLWTVRDCGADPRLSANYRSQRGQQWWMMINGDDDDKSPVEV